MFGIFENPAPRVHLPFLNSSKLAAPSKQSAVFPNTCVCLHGGVGHFVIEIFSGKTK